LRERAGHYQLTCLIEYGIRVGFVFIAESLMRFFKIGGFARDGILN